MTTSTPEIWISRAAREAQAALTAPSPQAARIHRGLAAAYRVRSVCEVPAIDGLFVAATTRTRKAPPRMIRRMAEVSLTGAD